MKITLKAARVSKDLTQAAAAKLLGTSPQTLSSYEQYKAYPDARMITKLLALYGRLFEDIIWVRDDTH